MIRVYSSSAASGHVVNEDAFVVRESPVAVFVALADGQGGRAGGARAAQLACEVAARHGPQAADAAVAADPAAGFTTLVTLFVEGDRLTGASCGDSAAAAVCGTGAPLILTSRQFKNPPVGSGDATFVPFDLKLVAPWKVLVMSDGAWKFASWERVWDCAARLSGDELLTALQEHARLKTTGEFQDDFTVVLLESE
ncbi:MAG: hypothetical protein FJ304_02675 [Planctomycetes bacterium]|nr:hypothetical protein [Planctomycetota bacterium]